MSEEPIKSIYNAAISQLYRLDQLWQDCHRYRNSGQLMKWNYTMDSIWTELGSDAQKGDVEGFDEFIKFIIENKDNKGKLYQILMKKEIWLRKLQNTQGKGTAYEDILEDIPE